MIRLDIQRFNSTNKTTHYELSQYVSSDLPTYLVDYNSDMSKIDAGINTAKTTADSASTAATNAATVAETAQTSANTAITNAATAQTAANTANTNIGTLANLTTVEKGTLVGAINEVDAANKEQILNAHSTSTTATYSAAYINELSDGEVLWTNPDPTQVFTAQTIILSSSNYRFIEIITRDFGTGNHTVTKIYKGNSARIVNFSSGGTLYERDFTYVDDTHYSVGAGTDSHTQVPVSVIGYY